MIAPHLFEMWGTRRYCPNFKLIFYLVSIPPSRYDAGALSTGSDESFALLHDADSLHGVCGICSAERRASPATACTTACFQPRCAQGLDEAGCAGDRCCRTAGGGLAQQDFTLLDNGKPQPVLSFRAIDGTKGDGIRNEPPVEVILLVDGSNTRLTNVAYERNQIEKFLKQNGGRLTQPTTLMIYTDRGVQTEAEPTTDGNALAQALDHAAATTHTFQLAGGDYAIERMNQSIRTLLKITTAEAQKPGRKLLLWIGQGWPMLEGYPESDQTRKIGFNAIVQIGHSLREARMTLYNINVAGPNDGQFLRMDSYVHFLKPVKSPREFDSGDLSVPVVAVHSGGGVFDSQGELADFLNRCVAEGKAYYTIGFDPPNAGRTDEYHAIEVTVSRPRVKAQTVTGYYAEPGLKP